jgi:CubicO group peptidase (beta-lactamase class C family)
MSNALSEDEPQACSRARLARRSFLGAVPLSFGITGAATGAQTAQPPVHSSQRSSVGRGGLSTARLDRMHRVLSRHVETSQVPGVVALLSRRGDVHVEALGYKKFGQGEPMRRDTIFRIASMTKPVTAVAALILIEECKLRLDEAVDELLPELSSRKVLKKLDGPLAETVPAKRRITVRDLLTFRLGIGLVFGSPDKYPILGAMREQKVDIGPELSTAAGSDAWIAGLGKLPLMHQPGEAWMYHTGSDVLGVLIERASGQALERFFRERIFDPLGMKDTGFSVPQEKLHRLATAYWSDPSTGKLQIFDGVNDSRWSRPPTFRSGGGGLVSTIDDYYVFGQTLLNGGRYGRERILSRPSVEAMITDQLTPEQKSASVFFPGFWENHGWGFGVAVITKRDGPTTTPGRFGWDGGYGTSWASDPKEGLVGILMTQRLLGPEGPPPVYSDFWSLAYQAIDD